LGNVLIDGESAVSARGYNEIGTLPSLISRERACVKNGAGRHLELPFRYKNLLLRDAGAGGSLASLDGQPSGQRSVLNNRNTQGIMKTPHHGETISVPTSSRFFLLRALFSCLPS
jgi:hypothetical protein